MDDASLGLTTKRARARRGGMCTEQFYRGINLAMIRQMWYGWFRAAQWEKGHQAIPMTRVVNSLPEYGLGCVGELVIRAEAYKASYPNDVYSDLACILTDAKRRPDGDGLYSLTAWLDEVSAPESARPYLQGFRHYWFTDWLRQSQYVTLCLPFERFKYYLDELGYVDPGAWRDVVAYRQGVVLASEFAPYLELLNRPRKHPSQTPRRVRELPK